MMKQASLEPGLLSVFRLFAGLHFGIALLGVLAHATSHELFNPIGMALLTVYLWWPGLPQRLGRAFLPLALGSHSNQSSFTQHFELIGAGRFRYLFDYGDIPITHRFVDRCQFPHDPQPHSRHR